jgi:hypothetical protein
MMIVEGLIYYRDAFYEKNTCLGSKIGACSPNARTKSLLPIGARCLERLELAMNLIRIPFLPRGSAAHTGRRMARHLLLSTMAGYLGKKYEACIRPTNAMQLEGALHD